MDRQHCNFVPLSFKREVGFHSHLHAPIDEFLMLAEDKAAIRDGEEITCKLPGSPRSTFLMVFSPDGTKIASTHGDHKIYISDMKSAKCLHTLEGHPRTPWCIAFHPSSNEILASGCLGGEVRIWDLHGGSEIWVTQQSSVIASLAFHPFDQVLVIATHNELFFWDWSKPQPFARCKTASDREKVRFVKFDPLGHKLITGIANLPIIQSSRSESMRTFANRCAMLRERYNRILESNTVGTDPVATREQLSSTTQAEALQSAREYARQVTSDALRSPNVLLSANLFRNEHEHSSFNEYYESENWRSRNPYSLPLNQSATSPPSSSSASATPAASSTPLSSFLTFQQEFINAVSSRLRDNSSNSSNNNNSERSDNNQSEMSLPSSLIQALVRLQRSLEMLEPRMSSVVDARNSEQTHLRQRIEEILNRLFNLYASITPLRILMDEVFQDFDREIVLAEVNRDGNESGAAPTGIASQLQELRQQLTRLLDRIFSSETDLPSQQEGAANPQTRRNVRTNTPSQSPETPADSSLPSTSRGTRRNLPTCTVDSRRVDSDTNNSDAVATEPVPTRNEASAPAASNQRNSLFLSLLNNESRSSESSALPSRRSNPVESPERNANGGSHANILNNQPSLSIPRVQIDPPEPHSNDADQGTQPRLRPRSPPLNSILQNEHSNRQQYIDYQAASTSGSGLSNRAFSNSLYLHPNYVASLFEESLQRTSALQMVINRAIAGTFLGNSDFAVVNNVMSLTHRIQSWDFSNLEIPDISDAQANLVVPECKIHNDASVDISADGHLLATLVPGSVGLPSTTVVGIFSLEKRTFGSCLYSYYFGPNAISVSLSPLSRYIVVGLASRKATVAPHEKQVVAQVFKLLTPMIDSQENLEHVRNVEQCGTARFHISLNSIRWLPQPGEGIVYGTNRGELRLCRPGPSKEDEYKYTKGISRMKSRNLLKGANLYVQSTSTQTVVPQTQSAGTQTGFDFDIGNGSQSSSFHL